MKATNNLKTICISGLSIFLLFFACKTQDELLLEGDFRKLINQLDNKAKKAKLLSAEKNLFIKAINGEQNTQRKSLEVFYISIEPKAWQKGMDLLYEIATNQEEYLSYSQIKQDDIVKIDIDKWYVAFGKKLYGFHKDKYERIVRDFDSSQDRNLMRMAYDELQMMKLYDEGELNLDSLMADALEIGHREYFVEIDNRSYEKYNFSYFENDIELENNLWSNYDGPKNSAYYMSIRLEDVSTDEFVDSDRVQNYRDKVVTGYQTVTDSTGTREVEVYTFVEARVRRISYVYRALANAEVNIYSNDNRENIYSRQFYDGAQEEVNWNYLESGDPAAVPPNIILYNSSFRPDEYYNFDYLIKDALEALAWELSRTINEI